MACVDVNLLHSYVSPALPVTIANDCDYCQKKFISLLLQNGAAIHDFRF